MPLHKTYVLDEEDPMVISALLYVVNSFEPCAS